MHYSPDHKKPAIIYEFELNSGYSPAKISTYIFLQLSFHCTIIRVCVYVYSQKSLMIQIKPCVLKYTLPIGILSHTKILH